MILKIKLNNSKYCNGCPCTTGNVLCRHYEILTLEHDATGIYTIRPEICKKENGIV